jgi:hypothetical protein
MRRINARVAKTVRKRSQKVKEPEWRRVMFSLNGDQFDAFKAVCDREGLMYSKVVEEFMKYYVETAKRK